MRRTLLLVLILLVLLFLACQHGHARNPTTLRPTSNPPSPTPDTCGFAGPGAGMYYHPGPGLCASTYAVLGHVAMAVLAERGDHVVVGVWAQGSEHRAMPEFGPPVVLRQGESRTWFFEAAAPAGEWAPDVVEARRAWLPLVAQ